MDIRQKQHSLYHALCLAIANSRGYSMQTMPIESIHIALNIADRAHTKALDNWWNNLDRSKGFILY